MADEATPDVSPEIIERLAELGYTILPPDQQPEGELTADGVFSSPTAEGDTDNFTGVAPDPSPVTVELTDLFRDLVPIVLARGAAFLRLLKPELIALATYRDAVRAEAEGRSDG